MSDHPPTTRVQGGFAQSIDSRLHTLDGDAGLMTVDALLDTCPGLSDSLSARNIQTALRYLEDCGIVWQPRGQAAALPLDREEITSADGFILLGDVELDPALVRKVMQDDQEQTP